MTTSLSIALERAREGIFYVHPLRGKTPILAGYNRLINNDPQRLEQNFTEFPGSNIGGVIRVGFCVLDIDTRYEGQQRLAELEAKYGQLPKTVTVVTASEGRHFYFRLPPAYSLAKASYKIVGSAVELLGKGHNLVLPGSVIDGKEYRYAADRNPSDIDIAEIPAWLLPSQQNSKKSSTACLKINIPDTIPDGTRHTILSSLAGSALNYGIRDKELEDWLSEIDREHCIPPLGEAEARTIARSMRHTHNTNPQNKEWNSKNRAAVLEITRYAIAANEEWRGITGKTELAALLGALAIAYKKSTLITPAAFRPIAEHGQIGLKSTYRAVKSLIRKGWLVLHASYYEYRRLLEEQEAPPQELAKVSNVYRFAVPDQYREKTTEGPTPPLAHSLLSLCGIEVFRNRGLGKSGLQLLMVLLRGPVKSRRQLALDSGVSPDTAERKVKKMIDVGVAKETDHGIELVDIETLDLNEVAKRLGTFGRGAADKARHAAQRERYYERIGLTKKEDNTKKEKEEQEIQRDEELSVYILNDNFPVGQGNRVEPLSIPIADEMPVPVDINVAEIFVKTVFNVFGGGTILQQGRPL